MPGDGDDGDDGGVDCASAAGLPNTPSILNFQRVILPIQSPPPPPPPLHVHPISVAVQENELGKLTLNLSVTVAVALLFFNDSKKKLGGAEVVLVGLMAGGMFIWNGILLRTTFHRLANVVELIGIGLVWISVFGLVASSLPTLWLTVLWICGGLCLVPVIVSLALSLFLKLQLHASISTTSSKANRRAHTGIC